MLRLVGGGGWGLGGGGFQTCSENHTGLFDCGIIRIGFFFFFFDFFFFFAVGVGGGGGGGGGGGCLAGVYDWIKRSGEGEW